MNSAERTFGNGFPARFAGSYSILIFRVHGPTALMWTESVFSLGADESVNGWYSDEFSSGQAILTHWPDL